jgi:PAS domain S-box-containing protein
VARAEETLRVIHAGEVDTIVVMGRRGPQLFTLKGAEHAYRVLVECMNEGALTMAADKTILYANQCFARMVHLPLEQVTGSSFRRFLGLEDRTTLRALLKRRNKGGAKARMILNLTDGASVAVQVSTRPMERNGFRRKTVGVVVTDMTEARRTEGVLRALTRRVVEAQETERGRVALELHDHITQLLCAILLQSSTLLDKISARDEPSVREAVKLRRMLGNAADEVERISANLRPSILAQLGLGAAMRGMTQEFSDRTGISARLSCAVFLVRLNPETELTLFRILQEALKNIEKHARASRVDVRLGRAGGEISLEIADNGIGFNPEGNAGFGLLGMRERAAYGGGSLTVTSGRRRGTEIGVRLPVGTPASGG